MTPRSRGLSSSSTMRLSVSRTRGRLPPGAVCETRYALRRDGSRSFATRGCLDSLARVAAVDQDRAEDRADQGEARTDEERDAEALVQCDQVAAGVGVVGRGIGDRRQDREAQ